ncbi:MAG: MFS transporter [Candidatus Bathyarchaeia archaeon]
MGASEGSVAMRGLRARWDYSYTVLLLCWFGWISIYLSRSVLAPILPVLSRELRMTHAQGGMLETAYLLGYIIVKVPVGIFANRIGIKRTLVIGIIGYAISNSLNFLATDFFHLFALRFMVGLFQGVHLPLANTLLSERFGDRQGRAIGFHESGPNVGNSIAYPLTVTIATTFGWRNAFVFLSLPAFALAGVTALILKEEKRPETLRSSGPSGADRARLRDFLWFLAPLALAHAVYNLCLRSLLIFAPSFLVESRGMSLAMAGLISMLMPAAGFVAKVSSGFVAERVGRVKAISSAIALSGLFILSMAYATGERILSVNFVALGLVLYSFSPIIYASVTSGLPTGLKSIGLGAVTIVGNIFGAFSTSLIGYLIDALGYQMALTIVSVIVILSTAVVFVGMRSESSRYGYTS